MSDVCVSFVHLESCLSLLLFFRPLCQVTQATRSVAGDSHRVADSQEERQAHDERSHRSVCQVCSERQAARVEGNFRFVFISHHLYLLRRVLPRSDFLAMPVNQVPFVLVVALLDNYYLYFYSYSF